LASGSIAKHFIAWISKNRVAENRYYVVSHRADTIPENIGANVTVIDADPTSFSKLKHIMDETRFSNLFIVMEKLGETSYVLKNLALIKSKTRTILVNQWDSIEIGEDFNNISIVNTNDLIASHLYDRLPNVPLVAQNVGLKEGEIMEVHVPFGSAYAYRHIGSILQHNWTIAALYRDRKQILPTNSTMIRPDDTLLILGKPIVLDGVYKTINRRLGLFPEPFGKDIYLILDLRHDSKNALLYLKESIYLVEKLEGKTLFVRVLYPNDFAFINELRAHESTKVTLSVCYKNEDLKSLVEQDIHRHNIGLVMNSIPTFEADDLKETLYNLKKVVFLFGEKLLYNIKSAVVLMSENEKMESISSLAFDISDGLGLWMTLGDFDPEGDFDLKGDFESKRMIVEHYETLADIFNIELRLEQRVSNPIRELSKMEGVLQIAPFEKRLNTYSLRKLISSKIQDFLLTTHRHPKLLVPFEDFAAPPKR
jgi:hypothetical protein